MCGILSFVLKIDTITSFIALEAFRISRKQNFNVKCELDFARLVTPTKVQNSKQCKSSVVRTRQMNDMKYTSRRYLKINFILYSWFRRLVHSIRMYTREYHELDKITNETADSLLYSFFLTMIPLMPCLVIRQMLKKRMEMIRLLICIAIDTRSYFLLDSSEITGGLDVGSNWLACSSSATKMPDDCGVMLPRTGKINFILMDCN